MIAEVKTVHVINSTPNRAKEISFYFLNATSSIREANFDLLEPKNGSFTRSSEAAFQDPRQNWAFVGTSSADNWKGVDEARIFNDGNILLEGSKTNLLLRSEELDVTVGAWSNGATNASASAETFTAPDFETDADFLYFQDATVNPQWRQTIAASNFTNNLTSSLSFWIQSTGSGQTEEVRLFSRDKSATDIRYTAVTASNNWQRFIHVFPNGSGTIGPLAGIRNGESGGIKTFRAWGAQVEADSNFPSSYIRTTTGTTTRGADQFSFLASAGSPFPEEINSGKWKIDVHPAWDSSQLPVSNFAYIMAQGNIDVLYFFNNTGVLELRLIGSAAALITPQPITFSAHQKITITIDWPTQQLTIEGATTGNGTTAISSNNWGINVNTERLTIGYSQATAGREFFGVISRPRRV